jgi:hypothetical protein
MAKIFAPRTEIWCGENGGYTHTLNGWAIIVPNPVETVR